MEKLWVKGKVSESLLIAMLLALVGGYLDIYTYLARGKVFANTQTGNLVLLGYNVAEGNWEKVAYYLLAILAFVVGIWVSKFIEHKFRSRKYFDWLHMVLVVESAVLLLVMWIPEDRWNFLANMSISFCCALQVQGFRKVNGNAYSTVMFTGNLKNLAERFSHYWLTKDLNALENALTFLSIILMFVMGGWLGALTTKALQIGRASCRERVYVLV